MAISSLSFFAKIIVVMSVLCVILAIVGNIIIHYPLVSGYYDYSIKITGLSDYQGDSVTQIVVPIPSLEGVSIISDEQFQHKTYGNWTSLLVVTEHGKMLAFQSIATNLTDLNACFAKEIRKYPTADEINGDLFVPTGRSLLRTENTTGNCTYIIIPDALQPLSNTSRPITVYVNLTIHNSGTTHNNSTTLDEPHLNREYHVSIAEQIPPGTTGVIPVEPQVYYRDSLSENFRPLENVFVN